VQQFVGLQVIQYCLLQIMQNPIILQSVQNIFLQSAQYPAAGWHYMQTNSQHFSPKRVGLQSMQENLSHMSQRAIATHSSWAQPVQFSHSSTSVFASGLLQFRLIQRQSHRHRLQLRVSPQCWQERRMNFFGWELTSKQASQTSQGVWASRAKRRW
jgi:hypothetical protein